MCVFLNWLFHDQILQSYEDILRKNQYHLEDKGKLKTTLSGLVRCLSLLPSKKPESEKVCSYCQSCVYHLSWLYYFGKKT